MPVPIDYVNRDSRASYVRFPLKIRGNDNSFFLWLRNMSV